jgi:hypothetical protein
LLCGKRVSRIAIREINKHTILRVLKDRFQNKGKKHGRILGSSTQTANKVIGKIERDQDKVQQQNHQKRSHCHSQLNR